HFRSVSLSPSTSSTATATATAAATDRMEGATDEAVCEICGSDSVQDRMVNCVQCNAYQHCYCLPVLIYQVTNDWCCDECRNESNGDPSPSQDGQTTVLEIPDDPRQKSESNATDNDIGRGSEMSPSNNTNILIVIHSSVEYARRPPPESCWTGSFLIFDGENHNLGEFKAYLPSKVSSKVLNVTKSMPKNLKLEMLPLADDWPKRFQAYLPVYEDIGLIFLPTELDRNEYRNPCPLKDGCNFVLRAYINNIKLLIYSSEALPPDSLWIDGEMYLWGVFVNSKRMRSPLRLGSIST
ncbi:hypothetical protein GUJ93_ZPchr0003g16686, partial [Zizania palustris]